MRIAVVGAGLAGLSLCYYLLEKGHKVTLFESHNIAAGASGVAAGLLHPYVGKKGERSELETEALEEARKLLKVAEEHSPVPLARYNGIYRLLWESPPAYDDILPYEKGYLITSGITVFIRRYLGSLFNLLKINGLKLSIKECTSLEPLDGFDQTVFALGAGLQKFDLPLPVKFVKGQILTCQFSGTLERSTLSDGYLAITEEEHIIQVGGSYEHHYKSQEPDLAAALDYLQPRVSSWFPQWDQLKILSCHAGVRVCRKNGYLPLIEKHKERCWILTAMGSKGLLYAPLYGRNLTHLIESGR